MDHSFTVSSRPARTGQAVAATMAARLIARIAASRRAAANRRAARVMREFDAHMLKDIGLTRDDLRRTLRDGRDY